MPARDLTDWRIAMRALARVTNCPHGETVEVKALTGERVALLCLDCDGQLPWDYWITLAERDLLPGTTTGSTGEGGDGN